MARAAAGPRLLLALAVAAAALRASQGSGVAVFEAPSQEAVERGRAVLDKWTSQAATERGLVNVLLGNTCFTTAIASLNRECSQLSNQQRCWLAIQFTMCFQRASGFKVLDCPATCSKWRSLQSCVEACTSVMDDKAHMTYSQFFGDVFNMCLFLQTQNFQQVTAALVQDMHTSSAAANASLAAIRSDIAGQARALSESLALLARLQAVQSEVAVAVQAGLTEVKAVGEMSAGLQRSMNTSLAMTSTLDSRQQDLMQGFSTLEEQHRAHAVRAAEALSQLAEGAAALEARQARYEALQARLLNASETLLDQSQGMSSLLHVLVHYQATGNAIISSLQSTSTSLQDVLFYAAALSVPLVFWTHPADVRLLLLAGVLGSWGCERAVLQHYAVVVRLLLGIRGGGGGGAAVLPALPSRVGDIKLGVRLAVMGGTLTAIVWLLAKQRAAQRHREAVFQAIQASLEEARHQQQLHQQQAAAAAAAHTAHMPPHLGQYPVPHPVTPQLAPGPLAVHSAGRPTPGRQARKGAPPGAAAAPLPPTLHHQQAAAATPPAAGNLSFAPWLRTGQAAPPSMAPVALPIQHAAGLPHMAHGHHHVSQQQAMLAWHPGAAGPAAAADAALGWQQAEADSCMDAEEAPGGPGAGGSGDGNEDACAATHPAAAAAAPAAAAAAGSRKNAPAERQPAPRARRATQRATAAAGAGAAAGGAAGAARRKRPAATAAAAVDEEGGGEGDADEPAAAEGSEGKGQQAAAAAGGAKGRRSKRQAR